MKSSLYQVTIANNHTFYVVAKNTDEAYEKLKKALDYYDWYFYNGRKLKSVEVVAENLFDSKDIFGEEN